MIYINDIPSLRTPDNGETFIVDDRKTKIALINGTAIQNGGIFFGAIQLTCVFSAANFELIKTLWLNNEKVSFTDQTGKTFTGLTLKFNKYSYVSKFNNYVTLEFELWKEE